MKIGIYDPYLDIFGGGERYTMTVAEYLSRNHEVDIFWEEKKIQKEIMRRLGIDIAKVNFTKNIFTRRGNLLRKLLRTRQYDLIFYLSDGSIPSTLARKNILHFQRPFPKVRGKTLLNRLKISRFQNVICNSYFTKRFIDRTYGLNSLVIYPPVEVEVFKPLLKKNIILSVGRFTETLHAKKQHILVEIFKKMSDKGLEGWKLILTGGVKKEDLDYVEKLKKMIKGYPVELTNNVSFKDLKKYYAEAKIYWHAAGFGEDEKKHPERMEHFGITTVEAMAAGCVPVVFSGGGQKEIVNFGENGFLWETTQELENYTFSLIEDEEKWQKFSLAAQKKSKDFSKEKFCQRINEIIKK